MANSHLEFLEVIPNLTEEKIASLREQLEVIHVLDGKEYQDGSVPEHLSPMDWLPRVSGHEGL
jgi:hypothetical protein